MAYCRCLQWSAILKVIALLLFVYLPCPAFANEMPLAGFPTNGIVIRNEDNIQIEKEVLRISKKNGIEVSYIFKNYSDKDITSEVAFPIPPYSYDPTGIIKYPVHGDFTVEVNGARQNYDEITRALIKGKDYTDTLTKLNISIKDFNEKNWSHGIFHHKFNSRSKSEQQQLIAAGVVTIGEEYEDDYVMPAWEVETTYFWKQTFPANSTISIKHTYTPNPSTDRYYAGRGLANSLSGQKFNVAELSEHHCLTPEQTKWVEKAISVPTAGIDLSSVDYILTTANYWKQPIKEFHLIIDADEVSNSYTQTVSTCFEKDKRTKVNDGYEVKIDNFIPKEEIQVYFLLMPNWNIQGTQANAENSQNQNDTADGSRVWTIRLFGTEHIFTLKKFHPAIVFPLWFLMMLLCGLLSYKNAINKNLDKRFWLIVGAVTAPLTLLYIYFIPNRK